MRRYVLFGCGALVLGGAAWHFGRPMPPAPRPEPAVAVVELPRPDAPKPPPRVIEVIDLARAYEPVREPEEVRPGGVDPATFIQVPQAAERIPPAIDVDNPIQVRGFSITTSIEADGTERLHVPPREMRSGDNPGFRGPGFGPLEDLLFFEEEMKPVRLDVMPREVTWEERLHQVREWNKKQEILAGGWEIIPLRSPIEPLDVMPRQVLSLPPEIASGLLNFVPSPQVPGELVFVPMGVPFTAPPEVPASLKGLINFVPTAKAAGNAAPVEALKVMPREVKLKVKQEERERSTGVRDDDLIGP